MTDNNKLPEDFFDGEQKVASGLRVLGTFRHIIPNTVKGYLIQFHYCPVDGVSTSQHPVIAWCVEDDKVIDAITLPSMPADAIYCFTATDECRQTTYTFPNGYLADSVKSARLYAASIFIGTVPHPKSKTITRNIP